MKIEIHIDNIEIQDIIDTLKDQGVDITRAEVESHYEEYFHGYVEVLYHYTGPSPEPQAGKQRRFPLKFLDPDAIMNVMKNKNTADTEELVTEDDVVATLMDAYEGYTDINDMNVKIQGTYEGLGMLTRNSGFVFKVGDQEFQVTVVER
jgi:hypothetical protein